MAGSSTFRESCVTSIEAPADWMGRQHGRRLLCILCEGRSDWLFSYARSLAFDAKEDHTELHPTEGWPLKPLQQAFEAMPDARWHDNRRRLVEVTQTSVDQLRDLQVLGMGTNVEKRERAASLAFAAAAFALRHEAALPDPTDDGEFPALVSRVRELLQVLGADSSSSSSAAEVMDSAAPPEALPALDEVPAAPSSLNIDAAISGGTQPSPDASDFRPYERADDFDFIARLPERHKSMLRGQFQDWYTGHWWWYYVGALKTYNDRTGVGFIESNAAMSDWGSDVVVNVNHVPMRWNLGQPVEFAVIVNHRGQPEAVDLNWLPPCSRRLTRTRAVS